MISLLALGPKDVIREVWIWDDISKVVSEEIFKKSRSDPQLLCST